jgi:hypothetical protein
MRPARLLLGTVFGFLLVETLVFHTSLYPSMLATNSSAGVLETFLYNERHRTAEDRNQVLAIGDSRMGFFPRYANALKPELGYTFATISTPGTTARCWYYMLRDVDPTRRRYAALIVPLYDYDDEETWEDFADRATDLHYLIARLRWSDLAEFSGSHHEPALQWQAARGILLNGFVYKADFQDFLLHPVARWKEVRLSRRDSHMWFYDYVGPTATVKGIGVDWQRGQVTAPLGTDPEMIRLFQTRYLEPRPPELGRRSAYLKYWLGKICDLYRGSGTRIIFIRLPRGPFLRPDQPPPNPHSSVRELASRPEVIVSPEHFFDALENPELFHDPYHLNSPGAAEFSRMLARHVRELLGEPRAS